jgi:predicted Co/Zn/Cd cation transporter (cation efflux family)
MNDRLVIGKGVMREFATGATPAKSRSARRRSASASRLVQARLAIKQMVVLQGMRLALVGMVIGLASAFGLSRFIASFLFGVKALDPTVYAAIPLLLTAVALVAVWIPARRASRVDPVIALRIQ